jgi:hypothetical protein
MPVDISRAEHHDTLSRLAITTSPAKDSGSSGSGRTSVMGSCTGTTLQNLEVPSSSNALLFKNTYQTASIGNHCQVALPQLEFAWLLLQF